MATAEGGENIIKTALDTFGRLDILVNNAGILRDRMIFNMSERSGTRSSPSTSRATSTARSPPPSSCASSATAGSSTSRSESGLFGNAGQANYGAAKSGIAGFTRVVARDLGRYGVTCNAIAPRAWTRLTATIPQQRRRRARQPPTTPTAPGDHPHGPGRRSRR